MCFENSGVGCAYLATATQVSGKPPEHVQQQAQLHACIAPEALGLSTSTICCCVMVIYEPMLEKKGALVVYQAEAHHVVMPCADESDDEQEAAGAVPSTRISTTMVNQATAHLQKDGR